jgi:hypothetical protein
MATPHRPYGRKVIRPDMTVRQIAVDFPPSQEVFRRHGEPDSPAGQFGHFEPLTHFARRLGLALDDLLIELAAAAGAPIDVHSVYSERVHRPFLLAALAVTLSLGAGWGAWLLWRIGVSQDFEGVPPAAVVAHGEAQLWGFIVPFIMGISLRTVMQAVARHRFGRATCLALLSLILAGVIGNFLWFLWPDVLTGFGTLSASLLLGMAAFYSLLQLFVLAPKIFPTWSRALVFSGFWLVAWAAVTLAYRGDAGPGDYSRSQRLLIIELAVFGFTMNSIYGFGQMLLPGLLRIGQPRDWAIEVAFWLHNLGALAVCLVTAGLWPGTWAAVGSALIAVGAFTYAFGQRAFIGRSRQSDRAEQGLPILDVYVPLAFFWLVASLMMLTAGYFYQTSSGNELPHAYVGAVRHALTVGFVTTLILGVGQRILPVLEHTVLPRPGLALPILLLIGIGNLVRVGSELAVLVTPAAYSIMPLSAVFEWTALALFAVGVVSTIRHVDPLLSAGRVTPMSSLAVLLAERPWIQDRLIQSGSEYLARARSVPHELTIAAFAKSEGHSVTELVHEINTALDNN